MIIPDANLLIYAYDTASPYHRKAKTWWEHTLSQPEPVGIPWVVLIGLRRIITHPQICENPYSVEEAENVVSSWFDMPQTQMIRLSNHAWRQFFGLLKEAGIGGNLTTDATIVLHAMEHSATVHTNDLDFQRFSGIRMVYPLND